MRGDDGAVVSPGPELHGPGPRAQHLPPAGRQGCSFSGARLSLLVARRSSAVPHWPLRAPASSLHLGLMQPLRSLGARGADCPLVSPEPPFGQDGGGADVTETG